MKIVNDYENTYYSNTSRQYGLCYTVYDCNKELHYEFIIKNNEATFITDDTAFEYSEAVIAEFRLNNKYIVKFYDVNHIFYREFDYVYSFKLPIKCLQPSKFFIDSDKLSIYEELDPDMICIPVAIINDEYVILDGHTRCYAMYQNDYKMINCYLEEYDSSINDFVYIAKENNINSIAKLNVVSHDEYVKYWDSFCDDYFNIK